MERTLKIVGKCHLQLETWPTHAHTCVPCSGIMVKHTWSSLSLTHARGPSEFSDAVSSACASVLRIQWAGEKILTREGVDVLNRSFEAHFGAS
jgi:hypothetical protein